MKKWFTVNVSEDKVEQAQLLGYNAYSSDGVTAIEISAENKRDAKQIATIHGFVVLYVFE